MSLPVRKDVTSKANISDARAIERNDFWVKPIIESGAEISLGGYRWRDNLHDNIDPKIEDEDIQKSIDILQSITGDMSIPKGRFLLPTWNYCR